MQTFRKILVTTIVFVVVLMLGGLTYLQFGDLSAHKNRILAAASDASGFSISVDGPFNLGVGREIRLRASDAKIANPAWAEGPELATLGELQIIVDTWSVLFGPLEIDLIQLDAAEITLQEDIDGKRNWVPPGEPNTAEPVDGDSTEPVIHRLVFRDFQLVQKLDEESVSRNDLTELRLIRTGENRYDYRLDGIFGNASPNISITASGALQFGAGLAELTDVRFDVDDAQVAISGPTLMAAEFTGVTEAKLDGDRPYLKIEVSVSKIEVQATETRPPEDADDFTSDDEVDTLLFSDSPLNYAGLNALDVDLEIEIESATVLGNQLSDFNSAATLHNGHLNVSPLEFSIDAGQFAGTLDLVPTDGQHRLQVDVDAQGLRLAQLRDENQSLSTVPPLDVRLTMSGQGASLHDIMSSSSGQLSGRQGNGEINMQTLDAFFSDFLTSIVRTLNPAAEERTLTGLDCGVFDIQIESGVADIQELAVQTDRLTIVSSGTVRFDTEEIDISMQTKLREGLGISLGSVANSFIELGGTLKQPALGVDAAGSVTSTGAAVATGGLSLLAKGLWDRVSSEVDICSVAGQQAEEQE